MPVHRLLEQMGATSLVEMSFRIEIARDLGLDLDQLDELPAGELDDWFLLYDVEAEAAQQEQINQERRRS